MKCKKKIINKIIRIRNKNKKNELIREMPNTFFLSWKGKRENIYLF